jgi:hypothetical protein
VELSQRVRVGVFFSKRSCKLGHGEIMGSTTRWRRVALATGGQVPAPGAWVPLPLARVSPTLHRSHVAEGDWRRENMGVHQIRPGAVLARIWETYRQQSQVLLGTAAILFILQLVLFLLIGGVAGLAAAVLFWVLSTVYQGMVVKLVQDVQDGRRDHSVGALLTSVEPVLLALIAVSILFAVGVGIGFVLFIVPGLILLVMWAVVAPVTVLEHPGVFAAFRRSRELVRGNGWEVFGVIAIVYLAVVVISIAAGIASTPLGAVGRAVVNWAVTVALAPVPALSASVLYFSLRDGYVDEGVAVGTQGPPQAPLV